MPTTPFLGVTEVAPNQSGKEAAINTAIRALEAAQNAALAVDMAAGDVTLSASQFTRNFIFKVTGLTATRILRIPAQINGVNANRIFAVRNVSNYPVTVQVSGAPGTFVTIPGGGLETRLLDVDGAGNIAQVSLPPTANAMITIEDATANHNVISTDVSNYLRMTSSSPNTITVPANAASSIGIGSRILVAQSGTGATSFVPANGVTILSPSSLQLRTRYSLVWLTKVGVDTWVLDGDLIGTAESRIVVNDLTTARTLVQSDVNAFIRMDNAAANTVTLPPNSAVPISVGSRVMIVQAGTGVTSIAAGAGVTVNTPGTLSCRARYSTIIATKVATDTWVLDGGLGGMAGASSIATLTDVDLTTPPTDGQALVYNQTSQKWKPGSVAAGGGGGGGSVAVSAMGSLFDEVMRFRTKNKEIAQYGAGDLKAGVIAAGDLRALIVDYYGNSGAAMGRDTAKLTIPAGKEAYLMYFAAGNYVRTNSGHYRWQLYNDTAGTTVFNPSGLNDTWEQQGFIMPDTANNLTDYPVRIGVAGQTISAGAFTSGDGNTRTISGFAIIALVDATTGDWSGPVSAGGGGTLAVQEKTASHLAVAADAEKLTEMNVAAANTFTIQSDATALMSIGTRLHISQMGAGQTSIVAGAGVTLISRGNALKIAGQYGVAVAYKRAANTWVVTGDIIA